jgi:cytochrome b561
MSISPSSSHNNMAKWALSSRIFHWTSAVLLLVTWAMILLHGNSEGNQFINLHKAFGVSLLLWTIARLINRLISKTPPAVPMPKLQALVGHLTHFILYGLLLAMPIAGLLMSLYGGRAVSMFGLFEIPVFVTPDRSLARVFNNIHVDIIWPMIIIFTLMHIGAALYHQFIKKDGLISRMK